MADGTGRHGALATHTAPPALDGALVGGAVPDLPLVGVLVPRDTDPLEDHAAPQVRGHTSLIPRFTPWAYPGQSSEIIPVLVPGQALPFLMLYVREQGEL